MPTRSSVLGTIERRKRLEYGDFQTPKPLAEAICHTLAAERPAAIVEPTCGVGHFFTTAVQQFPSARCALGFEINSSHITEARRSVATLRTTVRCDIRRADFFQTDWSIELARLPEPLLLVGNPPWVTNAALGALRSANHPRKENSQAWAGIKAITGKSNFDVSEWMIVRLLEALRGRRATFAMLCKTSVAQKVLIRSWDSDLPFEHCAIHRIDASAYFGANVEACLLVCRLGRHPQAHECDFFDGLDDTKPTRTIGSRDGHLIADLRAFERVQHLIGGRHRWRSGVKHDCAAVFELRRRGAALINGYDERVEIESRYVFPLLKSSHVGAGDAIRSDRMILVPQRRVGEETTTISRRAPQTWRYLLRYAERLDKRASAVYRKHPRFSVFGVGPYTFSKWKVAVSGFYKSLRFIAAGPTDGRPAILDDTCYLLPCRSANEARSRAQILNSYEAREFFSAFVFAEAKRPLTADILNLLDLDALQKLVSPQRIKRSSSQRE